MERLDCQNRASRGPKVLLGEVSRRCYLGFEAPCINRQKDRRMGASVATTILGSTKMTTIAATSARPRIPANFRRVITAAAGGNVIEWYDFYIFGSLATILSVKFFEKSNPVAALLSTIALFTAGFLVRPLGAFVFGWLGDRRGYYTGWLQTSPTLGIVLSLIVIIATRGYFGEAVFNDWAWRIPFLCSFLLVFVTMYMRANFEESPVYAEIKAKGNTSKNPWREALDRKR